MGPSIREALCLFLTCAYFTTQVAFAHKVEASFWSERQKAVRRHSEEVAGRDSSPSAQNDILLASLPASFKAPGSLLNQIPSIASTLPVQPRWSDSVKNRSFPVSQKFKTLINSIPLAYSSIQDIYDSGRKDGPAVVIVQDVHLNPEAQANIASVLQELITQKQVGLVGVEGAFGAFDFRRFRAFPDRQITKEVTEAFLKKNLLAAPSLVGIMSPQEPPLFLGVDDRQHYDANVQAYLSARSLKEKTIRQIHGVKQSLLEAKREIFSPELKEFDDLRSAYRKGDVGVGVYLKKLSEFKGRHSEVADLTIDRFLRACDMEKNLDFTQVDRERKLVLENLTKVLNQNELSQLLAESLAYRMGRLGFGAYYESLKNLCRKKGVDLRKTPAFDKYVRYVLISDGIQPNKLFAVIQKREQDILKALVRSPGEEKLARESEYVGLIEKLIDFSLAPQEWQEYWRLSRHSERSEESLRDGEILRRSAPQNDINVGGLSSFESFYREAEIRSQKMVDKLASRIPSPHRGRGIKGEGDTAVLITGGFHTPSVATLLRDRKISYVVVSPKITKVEAEGRNPERSRRIDGSAYLSIFAREKTPLDRLFAGEKLFVNPTEVNVASPAQAVLLIGQVSLKQEKVLPRETGVQRDADGDQFDEGRQHFIASQRKLSRFRYTKLQDLPLGGKLYHAAVRQPLLEGLLFHAPVYLISSTIPGFEGVLLGFAVNLILAFAFKWAHPRLPGEADQAYAQRQRKLFWIGLILGSVFLMPGLVQSLGSVGMNELSRLPGVLKNLSWKTSLVSIGLHSAYNTLVLALRLFPKGSWPRRLGDWLPLAAAAKNGGAQPAPPELPASVPIRQTAVLGRHTYWVNSASFSPDGTKIVTAGGDYTARVWDAETGRELTFLGGHTYWMYSASFSPDGRRVVTASDDRTARVYGPSPSLRSLVAQEGADPHRLAAVVWGFSQLISSLEPGASLFGYEALMQDSSTRAGTLHFLEQTSGTIRSNPDFLDSLRESFLFYLFSPAARRTLSGPLAQWVLLSIFDPQSWYPREALGLSEPDREHLRSDLALFALARYPWDRSEQYHAVLTHFLDTDFYARAWVRGTPEREALAREALGTEQAQRRLEQDPAFSLHHIAMDAISRHNDRLGAHSFSVDGIQITRYGVPLHPNWLPDKREALQEAAQRTVLPSDARVRVEGDPPLHSLKRSQEEWIPARIGTTGRLALIRRLWWLDEEHPLKFTNPQTGEKDQVYFAGYTQDRSTLFYELRKVEEGRVVFSELVSLCLDITRTEQIIHRDYILPYGFLTGQTSDIKEDLRRVRSIFLAPGELQGSAKELKTIIDRVLGRLKASTQAVKQAHQVIEEDSRRIETLLDLADRFKDDSGEPVSLDRFPETPEEAQVWLEAARAAGLSIQQFPTKDFIREVLKAIRSRLEGVLRQHLFLAQQITAYQRAEEENKEFQGITNFAVAVPAAFGPDLVTGHPKALSVIRKLEDEGKPKPDWGGAASGGLLMREQARWQRRLGSWGVRLSPRGYALGIAGWWEYLGALPIGLLAGGIAYLLTHDINEAILWGNTGLWGRFAIEHFLDYARNSKRVEADRAPPANRWISVSLAAVNILIGFRSDLLSSFLGLPPFPPVQLAIALAISGVGTHFGVNLAVPFVANLFRRQRDSSPFDKLRAQNDDERKSPSLQFASELIEYAVKRGDKLSTPDLVGEAVRLANGGELVRIDETMKDRAGAFAKRSIEECFQIGVESESH